MKNVIKGEITHIISPLYGIVSVVDEFYNDVPHLADSYIFFLPDLNFKFILGTRVYFKTFDSEVGVRANNLKKINNEKSIDRINTIKCPNCQKRSKTTLVKSGLNIFSECNRCGYLINKECNIFNTLIFGFILSPFLIFNYLKLKINNI